MANIKKILAIRTVDVRGAWYDHFADHWYEYPRKARTDSAQIPSISLRGNWISEAGFVLGEKLQVRVSGNSITLTGRKKA